MFEKTKYSEIKMFERYLPTAFDNTLTITEKVNKMVEEFNNLVTHNNNIVDYLNNFIENFDKNLYRTTEEVLKKWLDDGILAHMINELIFATHVYTYKNVGDMVDDMGIKLGDRVATSGYYTVGDGGHANYEITDEEIELDYGNFKLKNGLFAKLIHNNYVNIKQFGAKSDSTYNNQPHVMDSLKYNNVLVPVGNYGLSDTIVIPSGTTFIGEVETSRELGASSVFTFNGSIDNYKAVIQVGNNAVGAEPINAGSAITIKNIYVDCNNRAGFGFYGTYLSNDSILSTLSSRNSLEYNFYFARCWYTTFRDITSHSCRNNGIAFGMPLEFLSGTNVTWTTPNSLECNNIKIDNLRSLLAGSYFITNNYDINNPVLRRKGYGIGAGIGNGFHLTGFTSERSGGVNLYVYTSSQPVKTIRDGYLEKTMDYTSLAGNQKCGIVIENISTTGGTYVIDDVFMSYTNGGGIYVTGISGRRVRLKNIHQARFLRPLNYEGVENTQELYRTILKENVYTDAGTYNNDGSDDIIDYINMKVNSYYDLEGEPLGVEMNYVSTHQVYVRNIGTERPVGTIKLYSDTRPSIDLNFPTDLSETEWTYIGDMPLAYTRIAKGGVGGDGENYYSLKVIRKKPTGY